MIARRRGIGGFARGRGPRAGTRRKFSALGFCQKLAREVELVVFHQRLPYRQALRFQKRVGHGAADEHGVGELHQILHHFDFVAKLLRRPGPRRTGARDAKWLCRDRPAPFPSAGRRRTGCTNFVMPTTDAWARWAEPNASQTKRPSQSAASLREKFCVVGFFFGMVAHVFEQQHFAVAQRSALRFGFGADAVCGERHRLSAEQFLQARGYRQRASISDRPCLWAGRDARRAPAARRARSRDSASAAFRGCACRRRPCRLRVGTLKSTRMKTRLPVSCEIADGEFVHGSKFAYRMYSLRQHDDASASPDHTEHLRTTRWLSRNRQPLHLRQEFDQVAAAAGIAPLVVVPGQHLHAIIADDARVAGIHDRRMWVAAEIDGDQLFFRVCQDALHRAFGGALSARR